MRIFILLVMLIALAILVHQNNQHHTKLNPVSSRLLHPFDDRIRYKIAELDPRFGLSEEELIKITQEATQIWSLATGKDFFVYDPNARLGLHLIYDDRQYETEALQNIIMPITQRAYEAAQGQGGAEGFDPNAFQGGAGQSQQADDGVVDAEFKEVKDDKK